MPQRAQQLRTIIAAACIMLLALLCLCSCRYTDVLTEHYEDPVNGELNIHMEPEFRENPNAPLDPERPASAAGTSNERDEQEATAPTFSVTGTDVQATDQRQQEEESNKDQEASQGDEQSEQDGEHKRTSSTEAGTAQGSEASEDGDGSASGEADDSDPGDEGEGGDEGTGGKGGTGKVYNDGTYQDLPENVGSIAATGQYAVIVQMLAGKGGLAACDATTLKAMKKSGAFSYGDGDPEGLDGVAAVWSGDGHKNGSLDVDALIAAAPDAVLTDGATTALSEAETERLTQAGINVVAAPRLGTTYTADDDILTAVRLVGELLKEASTQYDASKMASRYVKQHDAALKACREANGGYSYKLVQGHSMAAIYQGEDSSGISTNDLSESRAYTAYIDSWTTKTRSNVTASRKFGTVSLYLSGKPMDVSDGVGLSAVCSKGSFVLMDYYLQQAGVADNSFDTAKPVTGSTGTSLPYAVIAGNPEKLLTIQFNRRSVPSALWFSAAGDSAWTTVGDASFPALMVRSTEIATKVTSSAKKSNGTYNVGQAYQVWVMPSGLAGSWADGTVESFLLSTWAYDMYHGDGQLDASLAYIEEFYTTFYRASYEDALQDLHTVKKVKSTQGGSDGDKADEAEEPASPAVDDEGREQAED